MTVADVSTGDQDAIGAFQESLEQKAVIDPAGAHESYQTNIGRILHPRYTSQIRTAISAPVTDKSDNFGFFQI